MEKSASSPNLNNKFEINHSEIGKDLENIIVSAGKIGYQIELNPFDLQKVINSKFEDII